MTKETKTLSSKMFMVKSAEKECYKSEWFNIKDVKQFIKEVMFEGMIAEEKLEKFKERAGEDLI